MAADASAPEVLVDVDLRGGVGFGGSDKRIRTRGEESEGSEPLTTKRRTRIQFDAMFLKDYVHIYKTGVSI